MKLHPFAKRISLAIATTTAAVAPLTMASDILTDSRYEGLRTEFLNINPSYYSEFDISGLNTTEMASFLAGKSTDSLLLLEEKTGGVSGNQNIYGASHSCTNSQGEQAVCWYNTGGTKGVLNGEDCGSSVENNYVLAVSDTSKHCKGSTPWSGFRFWLGAGNSTDFLKQHFPGGADMPVNRVCAEVEFPGADKLTIGYSGNSDLSGSPYLSQIVNPTTAGAHLRNLLWEWGTYTATKTTADGKTKDQEIGSVYQTGGSHFYHKATFNNRPPADRIYAIDENTLVMCMGTIPTGVRSGMRPAYAANPFLTLGGTDENGITTAPGYLDYVTRVYWQAEMDETSIASYPFDIAINKIWIMYEDNDIFAMNKSGGTLGLEMIESGKTAYHPFTLTNNADKQRTYRVIMNMGDNAMLKNPIDGFKLYIDVNKNGILDGTESTQEIEPNQTVTLSAKQNMAFIISHTPDFTSNYQSKDAHGTRYSQGSLSFIEEGRMRSASYAVRTWLGTPEQIQSKEAFFKATEYPSTDSDWSIYHQYNLGKNVDSNPDLIRNTPDFKTIYPLRRKPLPPYWN